MPAPEPLPPIRLSDASGAGRDKLDAVETLERMEALLRELRASVDEIARERSRRDLSPTRVVGAMLQALVIGLLALAGFDWAFQTPGSGLMTKLAFAATLQLVALTAFVVSRDGR